MLHRIQISSNTCEVTMQVKRAIGKATLHKLPIYNEYMYVLVLSLHIIIVVHVKAVIKGFDPYI